MNFIPLVLSFCGPNTEKPHSRNIYIFNKILYPPLISFNLKIINNNNKVSIYNQYKSGFNWIKPVRYARLIFGDA